MIVINGIWYNEEQYIILQEMEVKSLKSMEDFMYNKNVMIKQAIKKPIKIDFVEYIAGNNEDIIIKWLELYNCRAIIYDDGKIVIPTLEGDIAAENGDYIIKGVNNEFYPCKPDIFKATYDIVG